MAYLFRQIKTMLPFVAVLALGLFLIYRQIYADAQGALTYIPIGVALAFLMGVTASYGAGFVGMWLAVKGNVRSANAALTSFKKSMELAFQAGAVSGMFTVAFGLLGATIIFIVFRENATKVLVGFGFGGSLAALFLRVGGGIYTKAADVGGDLVGKVERESPRTIRETPPPSPTTWETTSGTAPEWRPTSSSPTRSPSSPESSSPPRSRSIRRSRRPTAKGQPPSG
jgi:K(+)-stimulated pyrophosphate-energized sodium pump